MCPAELRAQCLDEPYHQQGGVGERRPDKPSIPGSDLQTSSQTKTSHVSGVWTRHPDATSSYLGGARCAKGERLPEWTSLILAVPAFASPDFVSAR